MNQIAFIWSTTSVYWSGIITALAVLAVIFAAMGLQLLKGERATEMAYFLLFALPLSFVCARFVHWYCFYRQYTSLEQAFTDFNVGGFHLSGVILGVLLAALLMKLFRLTDSVRALLDTLAPAAALGLGAGRFSAAFNSFDRGSVIFTGEVLHTLPFATEVSNGLGGTEWRAAVFLWQGITALILAAILFVYTIRGLSDEERRPDGSVFSLFMLLFSVGEILFDSMRYDSAFLRSNGFVSLLQIIGLFVLIGEIVIYSRRSIRAEGFRPFYAALWALFAAGVGLAGFMEYFVQRHSDRYVFCYSFMTLGLVFCTAVILLLKRRAESRNS